MRDAGLLAGIRVIDLTKLLPGPLATKHLAEMGASVLKVEGPASDGQEDGTRHMGLTRADREAGRPSLIFRALNEGKQIVEIDLRSETGRTELLAHAREADLLVEGFRPGVMDKLGLGWEALHALNPKLVMCAISGYGQHNAWSHRAGHDINYIAMAGVLEQIATVEGDVAVPNFQIGDLMGGTQAAVSGMLAALLSAQRSGQGRFVDISMTHEVYRHHVLARIALAATGRTPAPGRDLLSGGAPCYGAYRCADARFMAVGALEMKFWRELCGVLGRPDWIERHWSRGLVPGSEASMALRAEVAAAFALEPMAHWASCFESVDACVTPVLRLDELAAHPVHATGQPPGVAAR
ncbi:CoA transferase [Rhizobacter sp. AJA081-3]|uniref:CaiB/BaiF CoA transferase family protein n=1 Tax=Rhizobacter sp. AJA081-3 TaxID=2753607 RepID=UPI001ADFD5DE|nr:CaiB/BaiF CoA-transferase family protein [Rhizobacter sp. AJA081-3]QTN21416.1 CoA transferase [Rhizobacter sp. AJA081-3]